jgi:anti-anti-sigma factor
MTVLTLTTSPEPDAVRVSLTGELDLSSALVFDEELKRIEEEAPDSTLVLDLRGLKFMDSTGLRLILNAHARAARRHRKLRVVPGSEPIRRIFRLTGMSERLDIVEEPAGHPA